MYRRLAGAVVGVALLALLSASSAQAATLPAGFAEETVVSGLTQPTAVRFSPDGRVFVAEKSGLIKEFDSLSDTTPRVYADLRTECARLLGPRACSASRWIRAFRRAA